MKNLKLGLLVIFATLAITSCKKSVFCHKPNGEIVTETRAVDGFTKIESNSFFIVNYTQGPKYDVSVEASSNLMEIIETKKNGSTLEIDIKKGKCIKNHDAVIINITAPNIDEIDFSGSGSFNTKNSCDFDNLKLNISGSAKINLNDAKINDLTTNISGSGEVNLIGNDTLNSHKIDVSGSGEIHALNFITNTVDANISGSGECELHVLNSLKVRISGSGKVKYNGTPTVDSKITGSGSVSHY